MGQDMKGYFASSRNVFVSPWHCLPLNTMPESVLKYLNSYGVSGGFISRAHLLIDRKTKVLPEN